MPRFYLLPIYSILFAGLLIGAGFFTAAAQVAPANQAVTADFAAPVNAAAPVNTCNVPSVGHATIQAAVDDALCDQIKLAAAAYNENVVIDRSVIIGGAGANATTLDGGSAGRVIEIPYNAGQDIIVTIFALKITGGDPSPALYGGGVFNEETLTLDDVIVESNSAASGGGVANGDQGVMLVDGSQVNGNAATATGGNIYNSGVMTVTASQASNATNGSGIYSIGPLTILNSDVNNNSEGGLHQRDAPLHMAGSKLDGNANFGVQIFSLNVMTDTASLDNVEVTNTQTGPALGNGLGVLGNVLLSIHDLLVDGSVGKGIDTSYAGDRTPVMTVTQSVIRNNQNNGIYLVGELWVDSTQILSNTAVSGGGGILRGALDKTLRVTNSQISNNVSGQCGGGIFAGADSDTLTTLIMISDSTISGNQADQGGGICLFGPNSEIRNTTISNNQVEDSGGGMLIGPLSSDQGSVTVVNSTLSGNKAKTDGGGIEVRKGVHEIRNATIVFNQSNSDADLSGSGGGLFISSGTVYMGNTLLAKNLTNAARSDCDGTLISFGNNLVGDNSNCNGLIAQDYFGNAGGALDPLVAALANNGGPTLTHALLDASPALDKGAEPNCASTQVFNQDQRGGTRFNVDGNLDGGVDGNPCDIGAYERFGLKLVFLPMVIR